MKWPKKMDVIVKAAKSGLWLNPLDAAGSLLDEALRRCEAK